MSLTQLVESVIEDGTVDDAEVVALEAALYEDGVIDQEEADALFTINDAVSGASNSPNWAPLFVRAITDFVLADEDTPGVVDEDEATYLIGKIEGDGQVDGVELELARNIKANATEVHSTLTAKFAEWGV